MTPHREGEAGVAKDVEQLMETVYYGNGEPGLVSRMTKMETSMATIVRLGWGIISAFLLSAAAAGIDIFRHSMK